MILILPITNIFDKIYACNLVCRLELAFYYLLVKNSVKIACSYDFVAENLFLPILCVYFQNAQNFEVAVTYADRWYLL